MDTIIYPELIASSITAENADDAIRQVGKIFLDNGFVKDTYIDAAIAREVNFPTGLQLKDIGIAMPHTDRQHVNKAAICIAKMEKPVQFGHMGSGEPKVAAEILFMMAILDPNDQVDNLQKVLKVFGSADAVAEFKAADTNEALYEVAKKYLD